MTEPTKKDDGGPAFPVIDVSQEWNSDAGEYDGVKTEVVASGMTLRDCFAGQALMGLLACDRFVTEISEAGVEWNITQAEERIVHPRLFARTAYAIADAMLKERAK